MAGFIPHGHGIDDPLSFFVSSLWDQPKRGLWEHPATQDERGSHCAQDDLIKPPGVDKGAYQSHQQYANSKEGIQMHGCPCARLLAEEFHHIDKGHPKIATGSLRGKETVIRVQLQWLRGLSSSQPHFRKNYLSSLCASLAPSLANLKGYLW